MMPVYLVRRALGALAIALTGAALGACSAAGAPGTAPTSALPATSVAVATSAPATSVAATSAPRPPSATAAPSAATATSVAQPVIGFEPKVGGPGTSVQVFGSGYAPGKHVVVRLGLPQPTGEALVSAVVDAGGRWSATLVIPDRLPSGEIITSGDMRLVAMDEENRALASAPFGFIRGAEPAPSDTPQSGWPGLGWSMAVETDANGDGVTDQVFYRPATMKPDQTFGDPRLDAVAVVASEIVVAQPSAEGPRVLLTIDLDGARADVPLFSYGGDHAPRAPAAYLLALDPARGPFINVLPVGAAGAGYGGPYGIDWSAEAGAFRLVK